MEVLAAGLLTSVQDAGRQRSRAFGVGVAGAVDAYSLAVANRLAGNPVDAAVLEITLAGPTLRLHRAATIAICGAAIDAHVDGVALPGWRPVALQAGSTIVMGPCRVGARAYLVVDGGIDVPAVLGSRSTDLRAGFGGFEGRALRAGDRLELGVPRLAVDHGDSVSIARWWIDPAPDLDLRLPPMEVAGGIPVRVLSGSDATVPVDALHAREFTVDAASNRQGLRLRGDVLRIADPRERISEPVVPGTVQLPPDGQPIVLLADAQTVGGYPRIGHVIAADLPRLGQLRAGQRLRFVAVDDRQAARANSEQRARLARITLAIAGRLH